MNYGIGSIEGIILGWKEFVAYPESNNMLIKIYVTMRNKRSCNLPANDPSRFCFKTYPKNLELTFVSILLLKFKHS